MAEKAASGAGDAAAEERALFAWAAEVCGGPILRSVRTSGGNRARSWALDVAGPGGTAEVFLRYAPPRPPGIEPYTVHREAQVYRLIDGAGLRAPRLIAEHPTIQAILTDRARGIAEFRRLADPAAKARIAAEVMEDLARLHALDVLGAKLDGGTSSPRIADHVRAELAIWRAMYRESGRGDALIDLAFRWLEGTMPDPDGPPVLVHGDAGPGNFLFEDGRLTALIDWELAHLGDPMEDLAWFSMRCVMEPVPDFRASLAAYARAAGRPLDAVRVLYHRVLVSTRVVVIRHRNVTGEPAHAIVSRALNRRLLVEALAEASGTAISPPPPVEAPPTGATALYDHVVDDLLPTVVARAGDAGAVSRAKSAAKVVKYLRALDRLGPSIEAAERAALAELFPGRAATLEEGRAALGAAVEAGTIPFAEALGFLAGQASREAALAAASSGGIAARHYPPLGATQDAP